MRLIDADALRENMYHEAFETDSEMQRWDSGCWIRYKMFENALNDAPAIDAVPVVHGEWEIIDGCVCCSVCGEPCMEFNYCPYCGAKMDEVEE